MADGIPAKDDFEDLCLEGMNILIAEDSNFSAKFLEHVLRAYGVISIKRVNDGSEAIAALREFPADICMIDWNMPDVNGIEFTEYIRTNDNSPSNAVPIVMVTGESNIDHVMQARHVGVTGYLIKPCTGAQVLDQVKTAMSKEGDTGTCFHGQANKDISGAITTESHSRKLKQHEVDQIFSDDSAMPSRY